VGFSYPMNRIKKGHTTMTERRGFGQDGGDRKMRKEHPG